MAKLLYQGHGSFRITKSDGYTIYVDPFAGEGYDRPADLILITHEHYDHTATDKVTKKDGCKIYRDKEFIIKKCRKIAYKTIEENGVTITATQAQNKNHPIDECVGFILELDGLKIYCAGDTSKTEAMQTELAALSLDYALLPGDGIYNMDVAEASECAALIGAKHTIPIHLAPGELFSEQAAADFDCAGKLVVRPGEEITL